MKNINLIINFFYKKYYFFFILYFILGLLVFKDYGVSTDEEFHRRIGIYWYNYIFENFFPNIKKYEFFIPNDFTVFQAKDFLFYGIIFDLPSVFLESFLKIKDAQNYIYLRHFLNFFIFFISSIFLFKLITHRFKKKSLAYFAVLFYVFSPRIFAESFYNYKDILFLSICLITCCQIYFFFKKKNFFRIFLISIYIAILFCIRPVAVILIFLFVIYLIIDLFYEKKKFLKNFYFLFSFGFFFIFFIFLFHPFFWNNLLDNFINYLFIFKQYSHDVYLFFNGDYLKTTKLPWYYSFVWIILTYPLIILIAFFFGFFLIFNRIFKRFLNIEKRKYNRFDLWNNHNEKFDLFIYSILFFSFFLILKLNATLYDGWRHIYFVHFFIVYFAIYFFYNLISFFKRFRRILFSILTIYFFILSYTNISYHPFQNIYFNFLIKNPHEYFDIDYWGLSYKDALKIILSKDQRNSITVSNASFTPLSRSILILNENERKRLRYSGQEYLISDYIITNNYSEVNKKLNKKYSIPSNFNLFYEKWINNVLIYQIYKKK